MLQAILSGETCAKCQNCCVFELLSAWELPTFPPETAERLKDKPEYKFTEERGRLRVELPFHGTQQPQPCPFLDPAKGCTLPPEEKPFACSIWPIRVMRDYTGKPRLALYKGCPGIPFEAHEALDALLENGLRERIFAEAEKDKSLVLPYHPNYRFL